MMTARQVSWPEYRLCRPDVPDYHVLSALARQRKLSIDDLVALAKQSNPFAVGAPA